MWNAAIRRFRRARSGRPAAPPVRRRQVTGERLEPRQLMAADPIHIGVVFLETDYLEVEQDQGSDSHPDRFFVTFTGGAPGTELRELTILTDKDRNGLSVGDLIFDTAPGGRGTEGWHPFKVDRLITADPNATVVAEVEDGSQELVLKLNGFRAGDRLEFTIDVDEVLRMFDDLEAFNRALDTIVSGQEFDGSHLNAVFEAPHYETATIDTVFLNHYGDPQSEYGLELPPNDGDHIYSRPNRSAGALGTLTQQPKPVSIRGTVWADDNLNLKRDAGESGIGGVQLSLWKLNPATGQFVDTGHRATTNSVGQYRFGTDLGLSPGTYRIVQAQPAGYFSVGAVVGTINGQQVGSAMTSDILTGIALELGDSHAVDYDFAEARPAAIGGYVYQDNNDDGRRDPGEPGIGGIRVRLEPVSTIVPTSARVATTAADGSYHFGNLVPGEYRLVQIDQPEGLADGLDSAGTINGVVVGVAQNPGDQIDFIVLHGGATGIEYNFGEIPYGSIAGSVFLAAPGEDCSGNHAETGTPLEGVRLVLEDQFGSFVAETTTSADGSYRFDQLPKGTYSVIEFTPAGLISGGAKAGTIDGVRVGQSDGSDAIRNIMIGAGSHGVGYDFCEFAPASLSGYVYHDLSNDGRRDPGEPGIPGALVRLLDSAGNEVARTTSGAHGRYEFTGVLPGNYRIVQQTPAGYLDGLDRAGTIDGKTVGQAINPGDEIRNVAIRQGQTGIDYNFGELMAASLAGRVHADLNGNCVWDPGEPLLSGVVIRLMDAQGNEVAQTSTDADGRYRFDNLVPGVYTVIQEQPDGYFDGATRAGSAGGDDSVPNIISGIVLTSGLTAIDYNFCELPPNELSGTVYVDRDGNHRRDPGEPGIGGVRIDLYDEGGSRVATTTTDAAGRYQFTGLPKGLYTIRQTQPQGYLEGGQQAGSHGGDASLQNAISSIPILWGQSLTDYDFYEWLPGSLSGRVWSDVDLNRRFDPGEQPIAGVQVELLDAQGRVVATTRTDSQGIYRFENLVPGIYSVRQQQPAGYFHGGQVAGSAGGNASVADLISEIPLAVGVDATGYNFPEVPPATISGYVFQDGPPLSLFDPPDPANLRQYRDGVRGPESLPIGGVTLELRSVLGEPFAADRALPGSYAGSSIRVVTDANGYYEFSGLRPGTYHIYQVQPEGYIDGLDTPGSKGGIAINAADPIDPQTQLLLQMLTLSEATDPGYDAILNVALPAGGHAREYNFSEILVQPLPPPPMAPPDDLLPPVFAPVETFPDKMYLFGFGSPADVRPPVLAALEQNYTWHLSVINAGFPRGEVTGEGAEVRPASIQLSEPDWTTAPRNRGRWFLFDRLGRRIVASETMTLGLEGATALTGDFNGDGRDQVAIFAGGQWFIDLNGNGIWDSDDLWIQLGTDQDRPIVGDWDGDGKDDIAIFGPQWNRDPQAILHDPGLPAPTNLRRLRPKNQPPSDPEATDGARWLQRTEHGRLRADVIDHVFRYGDQGDRPLAGDWNGDGIDTVAVFRGGRWLLDMDGDGRFTDADADLWFGQSGDEPVVGDWNGDGVDNLGVVRGDLWILDSDGDGQLTDADERILVPRGPNSQPIVGDWDGTGRDQPGLFEQVSDDESHQET